MAINLYSAYNLKIASEIALPELPLISGSPDVVVKLENLDHLDGSHVNRHDSIFGGLEDIGFALIENGQSITISLASIEAESMLAPSILGTCMAVILAQRNYLVLHASSVVVDGKAIAFIGNSGWGKSTLAATFHQQGYSVLTDDVLAIEFTESGPLVHPGFAQCKLLPDAASALGRNDLPPLYQQSYKLSYEFQEGFQTTAVPLQRIYLLGKGEAHQIIPLSPQQAFIGLIQQTRAPESLIDGTAQQRHLQQCAQLIQSVTCQHFIRKPGLADLPKLVSLVLEDVRVANLNL
jgi:hypothetical protein